MFFPVTRYDVKRNKNEGAGAGCGGLNYRLPLLNGTGRAGGKYIKWCFEV